MSWAMCARDGIFRDGRMRSGIRIRWRRTLPGLFCVGDVRHASIKRVSSGVGEGSMAIAFVHQYLALQSASAPLLVAAAD